jgi:hypothetical protein
LAKYLPKNGWQRFLPICHIPSMIAGSQYASEGVVADAATTAGAVLRRKRGCRHSRQVVVRCLPTVEFAVPILYEFETQSCPVPEPMLTEAGESLVLA